MYPARASRMANSTSAPTAEPAPLVPKTWPMNHTTAPTTAAAGRVSSQPATMRPATLQRTSAPRLPMPEPRIDPVATWVVDSAKPKWLDARMTAAEDASAGHTLRRLDPVSYTHLTLPT